MIKVQDKDRTVTTCKSSFRVKIRLKQSTESNNAIESLLTYIFSFFFVDDVYLYRYSHKLTDFVSCHSEQDKIGAACIEEKENKKKEMPRHPRQPQIWKTCLNAQK